MGMRNYLRHHEDLTYGVFWGCVASIVGSAMWILFHI